VPIFASELFILFLFSLSLFFSTLFPDFFFARFIDSEVDLDEDIKNLRSLAAFPQLYGDFLSSNALEKIIPLLNHANTGKNLLPIKWSILPAFNEGSSHTSKDIAIDVIDLLKDLTEADENLDEEDSKALVKQIVMTYFFSFRPWRDKDVNSILFC